jgi:hypothetical protein
VATKNTASHVKAMLPAFGDHDPATITPADVQEWIAGLPLKPSSIRRYVAMLRAILDYADVDPNPARDTRVRLPREQHTTIESPSSRDVEAIILHSPTRWRSTTAEATLGRTVKIWQKCLTGRLEGNRLLFCDAEGGSGHRCRRWAKNAHPQTEGSTDA